MSYESLITDPALVSYHMLQGIAGTTALDESPNGNHGTYVNMGADPVTVSGPTAWLPSAVSFDGSNDYMMYEGQVGALTAWTLAAWVKTSQTSGERWIFSEGSSSSNTPAIGLISQTGVLRGFCRGNSSTPTVDIRTPFILNDGVWHFIQFVRDGEEFDLYADGVKVGTATSSVSYPFTNRSAAGCLLRSSPGLYAEAMIAGSIKFSRALSLAEHQALLAGPAGGSVPENLSPPTLSIDSTSFTGSVGSWDSMGAGPLSYEWELRDETDAAIISGTGTTVSGSGSFSGSYYLWVTAANSVGASEGAASALVEASEPAESHDATADLGLSVSIVAASSRDSDAAAASGITIATAAVSQRDSLATASAGLSIDFAAVSQSPAVEAEAAASLGLSVDLIAAAQRDSLASSQVDIEIGLLAVSVREAIAAAECGLSIGLVAVAESPAVDPPVEDFDALAVLGLSVGTVALASRDSLAAAPAGLAIGFTAVASRPSVGGQNYLFISTIDGTLALSF